MNSYTPARSAPRSELVLSLQSSVERMYITQSAERFAVSSFKFQVSFNRSMNKGI